MSNELAVIEQNPLAEIENTNKIMGALMRLPHYKKMGEDVVFAIIAKARSLNIDPMYALNGGLYCIKGKIGMPAEAMAAMIREKGHSIIKDKASNDKICILHGKRKDNGDTWTTKFSIEDAKRAGIYANTWDKYPDTMCYNRAMSFMARQLFPDVIKGAGYIQEELMEISRAEHRPTKENELQEVPLIEVRTPISESECEILADILSQCDPAYLQNVWKTLRSMDPPITDLKQIPIDILDRMMKAATKNRESYQEQIAKIDSDSQAPEAA